MPYDGALTAVALSGANYLGRSIVKDQPRFRVFCWLTAPGDTNVGLGPKIGMSFMMKTREKDTFHFRLDTFCAMRWQAEQPAN